MALRNNLDKVRAAKSIEVSDFNALVLCKKCAYASKSETEGYCNCGKFGTALPEDFFCGYGVLEYIREREKEKFDDR